MLKHLIAVLLQNSLQLMWKRFLIFDLLKKWKSDNHNRYYFYQEKVSKVLNIKHRSKSKAIHLHLDSTGGCKVTDRQRIDRCPLYLLYKHNYHLKFVLILFTCTRHCNILKVCLIPFTRHCSIWENCATILHSFWQQVIPSMTRSLNNSSPVTLHWETVNMHPNLTP